MGPLCLFLIGSVSLPIVLNPRPSHPNRCGLDWTDLEPSMIGSLWMLMNRQWRSQIACLPSIAPEEGQSVCPAPPPRHLFFGLHLSCERFKLSRNENLDENEGADCFGVGKHFSP